MRQEVYHIKVKVSVKGRQSEYLQGILSNINPTVKMIDKKKVVIDRITKDCKDVFPNLNFQIEILEFKRLKMDFKISIQ